MTKPIIRSMTLALLPLSMLGAMAQSTSVRLRNPEAMSRPSEVVELPLDALSKRLKAPPAARYVAYVEGSQTALLTQVFASQANGPMDKLLVLVDFAPSQELAVTIRPWKSGDPIPPSKVRARDVPERKDDFAWENDVVAFRTYGPALQATGEISSGIDIWSKRVPAFITKTWYERDAESQRTHNPALSYHKDNGEGLDSYDVGPSRGCGGTAVFVDGQIFPSKNFTASHILADGPIRADFLLEYAPWDADGVTVRETKRITLDAGSKLNHIRSTFSFAGRASLTIAAGIAVHTGATVDHPNESIVSVWDTPQTASAGRIGTALIVPKMTHTFFEQPISGKLPGNALFLFSAQSGMTVDYYAGTAWSQADTPTQADFDKYLESAHARFRDPISIEWKPLSIPK